MTRSAILTLGTTVLLALALLCTLRHRGIVEAELVAGARSALAASDTAWAQVEARGCVLLVSGTAPAATAAAKVRTLLGRVPGVCRVAMEDPVGGTDRSPLRIAAAVSDGRIHLEGAVPDPETREAVLRRAAARFGSANVVDELELEPGAAPADWDKAALALVDAVADLSDGQGSLSGRSLDLQGIADNASSAMSARSTLSKSLPAGYEGTARISSIDESSTVTGAVCESLFRELMRQEIRFAPGSARIEASSFALLDRLAATAERCPGSRIEISGHTDSSGDPETNRRLSRERAEAVRTYFIQTGIAADRLVAVGHGDTRPIADNGTPEGRRKNRRIEFEIDKEAARR